MPAGKRNASASNSGGRKVAKVSFGPWVDRAIDGCGSIGFHKFNLFFLSLGPQIG